MVVNVRMRWSRQSAFDMSALDYVARAAGRRVLQSQCCSQCFCKGAPGTHLNARVANVEDKAHYLSEVLHNGDHGPTRSRW